MQEKNKFFKRISAIALASTLIVSGFPQIQLTQAATSFSLTSKVTIGRGETFQLNAKSSSKISFRSSNKKIVSVTKLGKIKGKKIGKATIIAKSNNKTKRCKVTVKAAPKKISFSQQKITLLPGQTKKLTVSFASGYSNKITYTSKNSAVASVSVNGIVTAKASGETTITAKTFNGKTATIRCIVADNSTPTPTNTAITTTTPATSPAITGTPVQTATETTCTPAVSSTPISSLEPTKAANTATPIPTEVAVTAMPLQSTATPKASKIPVTENPITAPMETPNATENVTPTPSAVVSATPSLAPTASAEATVTSSAIISKIENGTIYIDNNSTTLGLTSCISYYKTGFDGTLYDITKEELLPGDSIEITSSGLLLETYPSTLCDCDMIIVKESAADAILEDKVFNIIDGHTLEVVNHKDAKFYFDGDTKIYKNGQEITLKELKTNDVVRVCAYNPTIKGNDTTIASMDSYVGYARTIVVLGDTIDGLQEETAYFFYPNNADPENGGVIWNTNRGSYLVTTDTLLEITQPDGSIKYQYLTKLNQVPPLSAELTIYYKTLSEDTVAFNTTKKIIRVSYTEYSDASDASDDPMATIAPKKPVIYLYPEEKTDVTVDLDFDGKLTYTYPYTEDGHWEVTADTDGTLTNKADGLEYSYLFWEGVTDNFTADFSKGFCVKGEDTTKFLQAVLPQMGLTPKEYNEFIVYWAPLMQENAYNLISFQTDNYEANAPLTINPVPDSMLRVYMAYKPLTSPVEIEPQTFESFERTGFTVVEWGGCVVNN